MTVATRDLGALDARVALRQGSFELDIALVVAPGSTVAILGPNGAGKTTVLRALAGLVELDEGHVRLGDRLLDDATGRHYVPPEQRPCGVVFQQDLLFPHDTARENVAFGVRSRGATRADARRRADEWLARLDVTSVASQRPDQLSGGQARRVALARTLATDPWLLLLDEPLTSLDVSAGAAARALLRDHLAHHDGPCVLVTHDPVDAFTLADAVVIIEAGAVVQRGTPAEITARPRSRYAADLAGVNLLSGTLEDADTVRVASGTRLAVVDTGLPVGTPVVAVVHPRAVALYGSRPDGSPRNVWPVRVVAVDDEGARTRVELSGAVELVAEITSAAARELQVAPDTDVWCTVKASEIVVTRA